VIRPPTGDVGLLDFQGGAGLVDGGAAATREAAGALAALSVGDAEWAAYLKRQRRKTPSFALRSVTIETAGSLPSREVRRAVRTRSRSLLDAKVLSGDLDRLWEAGDYERVDFELAPAGADEFDLRLIAHPKPWGPNYVRFGLSLASDLEGETSFGLLGNLTMTELDRWGREAKLRVEAGESPSFAVELHQPLAPSRVPFVTAAAQYGQVKRSLFVGDELVQFRFREVIGGLDLGLDLGRYGELRTGIRHRRVASDAFGDRPAEVPDFSSTDAGWQTALIFDQIDRLNFPRRGVLLSAQHYRADESLGADVEFSQFDFQLVAAQTYKRSTLLALAHSTSSLGTTLPPERRVQLGGLFNLSGFPQGRVSGNYGGTAALLYLYRLGHLPKFGEGIYAGLSLEAGNAWESSAEVRWSDLRHAWAVVFGADTLLGPLYVAHGRSAGGNDSYYLYLGRTF